MMIVGIIIFLVFVFIAIIIGAIEEKKKQDKLNEKKD